MPEVSTPPPTTPPRATPPPPARPKVAAPPVARPRTLFHRHRRQTAAPPATVYVRRAGGNNTPWFIASFFLLLGGVAVIWAFYSSGSKPAIEVAEEEDAPPPQETETDYRLPDIIEHPESDGERPPTNAPVSEEADAEIEDAGLAPPPPPPPPKKEPQKLPRPRLIKKTIANVIERDPELPPPSDERTVDILIVYTAKTREVLGGHKGVLKRANEVVAYTNKKFHEGKVRGTLRLVGLVETEYAPPKDAEDIVKHGLGAVSSGYARCGKEGVHKIRNKVGADLVCMWVDASRGGGGGLAMVHGAWSSMNLPVTSIFRHEMAHNFGWNHQDRKDYSMINRNYPGMAKWNRKKIAKDKLYIQYTTEYKEED